MSLFCFQFAYYNFGPICLIDLIPNVSENRMNTPGTAGGPGGRDLMLAHGNVGPETFFKIVKVYATGPGKLPLPITI